MTAPCRVGVNLLWLVPGVVGGSEEYTTRLLAGLAERAPDDLAVELFALAPFARAHPELARAYRTTLLRLDGRAKPARVAAESTWLAEAGRRRRVELMHHAGGILPPVRRAPAVLTVHDLQPLVMPANFSAAKRTFSRIAVPRSARAARLIVTPSEHVRASVVDQLGVSGHRVRVVPHGIEPRPTSPTPEAVAELRRRHGLDGPFFVYPAITYPHKNHLVLLRALAAVAERVPDAALVLTGRAGQTEALVAAEAERLGVADRVKRLGRVDRTELDVLYADATALVFPSRFEGFGAPVLEAMSRGCPVIAAAATALPEVVGDAGVLVDPDDAPAWSAAMVAMATDEADRERYRQLGLVRAAGFTWDRAAAALADSYRAGAAAKLGGS